MSTYEDVWGQLFSGQENNYYLISKRQFIIGRAEDCDLHVESQLISDRHCYLLKDDSGQVWLYDTSTSGTLLNQKKTNPGRSLYEKESKWITNGHYGKIEDGDEFFLHSPKEHLNNLNFTFYKVGDSLNTMVGCRESSEGSTSSKSRRRDAASEESCSEPPKKKKKSENTSIDKTKPTTSSDDALCQASTEEYSGMKPQNKEKMEDALTCSICQDIFHDCISVQPCMHSFCGGCYAPWMKKSTNCPTCRIKVLRISKNHIVNNLVEAFLSEFPNKKRPDSELKDLDARNTITQDMLYPKRDQNGDNASDDSQDNDNLDNIFFGAWTTAHEVNSETYPLNDDRYNAYVVEWQAAMRSPESLNNNDFVESDHSNILSDDDSDYVPSESAHSNRSAESESSSSDRESDNWRNENSLDLGSESSRTPLLSDNSWATAEYDSPVADSLSERNSAAEDSDNESAEVGSRTDDSDNSINTNPQSPAPENSSRLHELSNNSWASAEYDSNAADSWSERNSTTEDSDSESTKVEVGSRAEDSESSDSE